MVIRMTSSYRTSDRRGQTFFTSCAHFPMDTPSLSSVFSLFGSSFLSWLVINFDIRYKALDMCRSAEDYDKKSLTSPHMLDSMSDIQQVRSYVASPSNMVFRVNNNDNPFYCYLPFLTLRLLFLVRVAYHSSASIFSDLLVSNYLDHGFALP